MKSKNDPILDAQAICQANPVTEEELTKQLLEVGWSESLVPEVIRVATGTYIQKGVDGRFVPRNGTTEDVVRKVLSS